MSLSNKLSITDVDLKGKRVLVRVSLTQPGQPLRDSAATLVGISPIE